MNSQTMLNSLPSTKVGSAMRSRPNTRRGRVITLPKNDRGVISPYPTVVIAVLKVRGGKCGHGCRVVLTDYDKPTKWHVNVN